MDKAMSSSVARSVRLVETMAGPVGVLVSAKEEEDIFVDLRTSTL